MLEKCSKEDFATLRRQYLPANTVIQEGESLALLNALAAFYRGENFIATVAEGRILELLGNMEQAPAIVTALGLSEAVIRTPGTEPFAMYRPISNAAKPEYFAFAFD